MCHRFYKEYLKTVTELGKVHIIFARKENDSKAENESCLIWLGNEIFL